MENRGVTLIELISVLAISAILGLIAVPAMSHFIQQQQLRSAAYNLYHLLVNARATAISQQQRVSVWNQDGDWRSGVELFVDSNNNGQRESTETSLYTTTDQENIHINGNRWVANYVSYLPNGRAATASGAFQAGTISLCKSGLNDKYQLVISIGGRLRLQKSSSSRCP